MKLGLESFSTRNSGLDPVGVLNLAADLGLQGVLFELSPFNSFKDDELDRIKKTAADKGLYLEFGMGSIIHRHPMAEKGRDLLDDAGYDITISDAQVVIDHLKIAQKLGAPILRCVGGPSCVAKNRYAITEELPLEWAAFVQAMSSNQRQGTRQDG